MVLEGIYTSALSYHGLQVSNSSCVGSFAGILYSHAIIVNLSDDSKLLTNCPLHIKVPSTVARQAFYECSESLVLVPESYGQFHDM